MVQTRQAFQGFNHPEDSSSTLHVHLNPSSRFSKSVLLLPPCIPLPAFFATLFTSEHFVENKLAGCFGTELPTKSTEFVGLSGREYQGQMVLCSLSSFQLLISVQIPSVTDKAFVNEACDHGATVCVEQPCNLINPLVLVRKKIANGYSPLLAGRKVEGVLWNDVFLLGYAEPFWRVKIRFEHSREVSS